MWHIWQKYQLLFTRNIISSIQYRSEMTIWFLLSLITPLMLFFVWQSIFSESGSIRGYQLGDLVEYYILVTIFSAVTGVYFEGWRSREIREGKIDHYLTKPVSYFGRIFFADLGGKVFYLLISLPILLVIYSWFYQRFPQSIAFPSLINYLSMPLFLVLSYLAQILMAYIIVLLTFWFEGAEGLQHFKWIVLALFSGEIIPINFMPPWLKQITLMLPLKYFYAIPISAWQGFYQLRLIDWIYVLGFVMILAIFSHWLWQKARYQYASTG